MRKKNILRLFSGLLLIGFLLANFSHAQVGKWGNYGSDPVSILDKVNDDANNVGDGYKVQDTALDGVDAGPGKYRINNTLDWIRQNISPYLQWAVYIGLSVAVILLIYNGFLLVTSAVNDSGKWDKVKGNITNILTGVVILTGFYAIFKLVIALINAIFGSGYRD